MNLEDGIRRYKSKRSYWQFTLGIEESSQKVLTLLKQYGTEPPPSALQLAKDLLISIEKWKATCLQSKTGNAQENSPKMIWKSFLSMLNARSDVGAMLSIMDLRGFGSSIDQRTGQHRAKRATAVLRFFKPDEWGVVDWRTCAMVNELKESNWDIDRAIERAKRFRADDLRDKYDVVNEAMASEVNRLYRVKRSAPPLARAADIDMALFGLSLYVWPMPGW